MTDAPSSPRRLALVGESPSAEPSVPGPLPAETAPVPEKAPDLLAALDAGDEEAVKLWLRAHTPETSSLVVYGLLLGAGVAGLVEWPALIISALAQLVVDRRLGGVENVVAELRGTVRQVY